MKLLLNITKYICLFNFKLIWKDDVPYRLLCGLGCFHKGCFRYSYCNSKLCCYNSKPYCCNSNNTPIVTTLTTALCYNSTTLFYIVATLTMLLQFSVFQVVNLRHNFRENEDEIENYKTCVLCRMSKSSNTWEDF